MDDHKTPIAELRRLYSIYEATRLAEAHTLFLRHAEETGDAALAALERERIGSLLKHVLERDDTPAHALNALAWSVATQGVYLEESLEAARRAVALEPTWEILDTLGEVLFRLDRREEAVATGRKALELAPEQDYLKQQIRRFGGEPIPGRRGQSEDP